MIRELHPDIYRVTSPLEYGKVRRNRHSLVAKGAIAAATGLSLVLSACSAEQPPIDRSNNTVSRMDTTTPSPVEVIPTPIVSVEKVATNGEFTASPTWEQDFSTMPNGPVRTDAWNIRVGHAPGNDEAEYNTAQEANLRIENGVLIMQAKKQDIRGYHYTSARIDTLNRVGFEYGKFVIQAKLPEGAGTWPAIWMMPVDGRYEHYSTGNDAYLNDGEIDIAESIGTEPNTVYGIAHNVAHPPTGIGDYFGTTKVPDNSSKFHSYGMEWTPTQITFTVDGKPYYRYKKPKGSTYKVWPYDQRFYLIIDNALGGTWGGGAKDIFPPDGVDQSALPATMEIKKIVYYNYVAPHTKQK